MSDTQETKAEDIGQLKSSKACQEVHKSATGEKLTAQKKWSSVSDTTGDTDREYLSATETEDPELEDDAQSHTFMFCSEYSFPANPLLIKYTTGIDGEVNEILICTADVVETAVRQHTDMEKSDVVRILLAKSSTYLGKQVHLFFDPRNLSGGPDAGLVELHPSPGRHNLLEDINVPKKNSATANKPIAEASALDSTDRCRESRTSVGDGTLTVSEVKQDQIAIDSSPGPNPPQQSEDRKKLKIRSCRRKKSRTSLKRVDIRRIVSSVFGNFFHFYALLGGHLKSGSVITKSGSNHWLWEAGVAKDNCSREAANDLFVAIAGTKVVLNIFDYLQFLIAFARRKQIAVTDLVTQLTVCNLPRYPANEPPIRKTRRRTTKEGPNAVEQEKMLAHRKRWFQSLPNL